MRIKTAPRQRILQNNVQIASGTKSFPDEESDAVEKCYDSAYTISNQDSCQMYTSPSRIFPIMTSITSSNELTSSTSTSPSLTNDDNNNVEVMNLSIKDGSKRVDEIALADASAEPEDKLKDSFLYKIMTDPNFLERIQKNKQPKKFICVFCKEEFTTCTELTNHMDAKKNESNQIACCACKKTFTERRYLKYHQRCHSERTKFTCDICTRKYTRLDNLTRHNVLHVNPDKFSCTICNRTFTRKDLLNKHRKSHEKCNLYCTKCGKYFRSIITLENHQKTHQEASNTSATTVCQTESSVSTGNVVCKTENSVLTENKVCETQNLILSKNLVCKTDVGQKAQNLSSDVH